MPSVVEGIYDKSTMDLLGDLSIDIYEDLWGFTLW